ncbi:hypothetical protein [Ornithinimicrobium kibberense]|uniref:hypothetical protein n=1 Tax=Ornithinimicrobium kibberense TaxID=282060 RepID=UPI003609FB65
MRHQHPGERLLPRRPPLHPHGGHRPTGLEQLSHRRQAPLPADLREVTVRPVRHGRQHAPVPRRRASCQSRPVDDGRRTWGAAVGDLRPLYRAVVSHRSLGRPM